MSCRSAQLGGHALTCQDCAHVQVAYKSCRNRHCPKCQGSAAKRWLAARILDVLPVEYYHLVFDQHEIVIANGPPSESFFLRPEALKAEALEEITALFPTLKSGMIPFVLAAHSPDAQKQKRLIKRYLDNSKPLQAATNCQLSLML